MTAKRFVDRGFWFGVIPKLECIRSYRFPVMDKKTWCQDVMFSNAEWNYNRKREKSKYLDNISVLPTSIFIFDKFVDSAQPEVAGEIAGRMDWT
jgi:hypothetical protein